MLIKIRGSRLMHEGKFEVIKQFNEGLNVQLFLSKLDDKLVVQNSQGQLCGCVDTRDIDVSNLAVPNMVKVVQTNTTSFFVEVLN